MTDFYIDIIIVSVYLFLTLAIGILKGRKINSIKEFAVGDYNFSDSTIIATLTATWIGAGPTIGAVNKSFEFGIVWLLIFCSWSIGVFILKILSPRISKFKGCISVSEIMGLCYGEKAKLISSICVILVGMGVLAAQIVAIGYLFNQFFEIEPFIGIIIGSTILVIYSSFGGIKAVAGTDLIQFAFFMIAIPVVANILLNNSGGYSALLTKLPPEHLKIFPSTGTKMEYIILILFFAIPFFDACLVQRVLMAKDNAQIVRSFKSTALIMILFFALLGIIGLSVKAISPNIDPSNVLYYAIMNYLPYGIKGLAIAGLLAVIMSTADSFLNSSSVALVNDFLPSVLKIKLNSRFELILVRLITFLLGIGAVLIAINSNNIVQIMIKTWIVWAPIMVVPLYSAFMGFRSNSSIFLSSSFAGMVLVILWLIFDVESKTSIESTIPGLFTNLFVFIGMTLYYKKYHPEKLSLPNYPNKDYKLEHEVKFFDAFRSNISNIKSKYKSYLPTLSNLVSFSRNRVHYYGAQYNMFAYFAIASFAFPYFMWSESSHIIIFGQEISILMRFFGAIIAFILGLHDIIPEKYKKYLPIYWHIVLTYSLPFMTTFLFLYNKGTTEWFVNIALSGLLLALLTDWLSFIFISVIGVSLGYYFFLSMAGEHNVNLILQDHTKIYLLFYVIFFSTVIGMLFSRGKEYVHKKLVELLDTKISERTRELENALLVKQEFLNNLNHEIRTPIMGVVNFSQILDENWDVLPENKRKELARNLHLSSDRFYEFINNIFSLSNFSQGRVELNISDVDLKELAQEIINLRHNLQPKKSLEVILNIETADTMVKADRFKISQVIRSILSNSLKYSLNGKIYVTISDFEKKDHKDRLISGKCVTISDNGIGIPEDELEVIFDPFSQSSRTKNLAGGRGLSLAVTKKIIEAHSGIIWANNNPEGGASFSFIIPKSQ